MICNFMDSDAKDASAIEGEDNDDATNIDTNYAPPPQKKSRQTDKQRNELANTPKKIKNRNNLFSFFYTINLFLSK